MGPTMTAAGRTRSCAFLLGAACLLALCASPAVAQRDSLLGLAAKADALSRPRFGKRAPFGGGRSSLLSDLAARADAAGRPRFGKRALVIVPPEFFRHAKRRSPLDNYDFDLMQTLDDAGRR